MIFIGTEKANNVLIDDNSVALIARRQVKNFYKREELDTKVHINNYIRIRPYRCVLQNDRYRNVNMSRQRSVHDESRTSAETTESTRQRRDAQNLRSMFK